MTYEVHGPSARYRIGRYKTAGEALAEACSRIYANEKTRAHALERLEAGEEATLEYGFSAVTVHVKGGV